MDQFCYIPKMNKSIEQRVEDLEHFYRDIPELVNTRFNRVNRELADVKSDISELKDRMANVEVRLGNLEVKFDTFPTVVAEVIREELAKR
ncbi:MAG: hypothetical protein AAF346_15845 [Pseudomonadota bacterium]